MFRQLTVTPLESQNLVAGANETGYHLMNTNVGRDYRAEIVADLVQACGGYVSDPERLLAGGIMTGRALATDGGNVAIRRNLALAFYKAGRVAEAALRLQGWEQ